MKNIFLSFFAGLPALAVAVDLSRAGTDVTFVERYAYSTNRAEVIATLQPETPAWYLYSILNAQTEGRLADARALLNRWDGDADDLLMRQRLLEFDPAHPNLMRLRQTLDMAGISVQQRSRETALTPNTYPSVLDQKAIGFEAFKQQGGRLKPAFQFLAFQPGVEIPRWRFDPMNEDLLPDTPGLEAALIAYLKDPRHRAAFSHRGVYAKLTLGQLARLAMALGGTSGDLSGSSHYAEVVLGKMDKGVEDDFASDPAAEKEMLLRKVRFVDTLSPALDSIKSGAYAKLLDYGRRQGEELQFESAFKTYLSLLDSETREGRRLIRSRLLDDALVAGYLTAYRRAGSDLSAYANLFEKAAFARFLARTDLLLGRSAEAANAKVLTPAEFNALQNRSELIWSPANPAVFAGDDDVKLTLDVKNINRLRLSLYALDPFEASRLIGGEVRSDIDLDGAVPTLSRVLDFSSYPAMTRHRETLILPELKKPGLYVVECSGAGISSRVLVRKGQLRVTERQDAGGHVFTALDEKGRCVKGTKLRLGEMVFTADENGEIAVPFAQDEKSAGRACAVVGDGSLASTIWFTHATETIDLSMAVVLPSEALIAGRHATALLRPRLSVSGRPATLGLLKDAQLTLTFTDLDGGTIIRPYPDLKLADDAETVVTFTVPERLGTVQLTLTGKVRKATDGKDVELKAVGGAGVNAICTTQTIDQYFLCRTSSGYVLELKGRTGEPLAARAVDLTLEHRAFDNRVVCRLQTDAAGTIRLGALADIATVSVAGAEGSRPASWNLPDRVALPPALSLSEGETVELPLRTLFAGSWPGAQKLATRVSLLAHNADGTITEDCLSACSYTNGVLLIRGLKAGDYSLTLRDRRARSCLISVVKTAEGVADGGVLSSATRSVTDIGSPSRLRIAGAAFSTNGLLTVKLANATPEARVHLFAARTYPDASDARLPDAVLAGALETPAVARGIWGTKVSDYVSGRDLGEKLRYVLDRRDQPHRIGNLLDRPSLLLNPWSKSETETTDVVLDDGEAWRKADAAGATSIHGGQAHGRGFGRSCPQVSRHCRDFLPQAETLLANLRPDGDGVVSVDVGKAGEVGLLAQDFTVVVTDGQALDSVNLLGNPIAYQPRDFRYTKAQRATSVAASKTYATVGDLFALFDSGRFAFLAQWPAKSPEEKKALYDTFASHELDFFLYEQDRPFFDAVVKPHLANKRLKRFVDHWLLGDDVSSYAQQGEFENLNVFEQCLLARRLPAVARQIARRYADWCDAHPLDPAHVVAAYDKALCRSDGDGSDSSGRGAANNGPVVMCAKPLAENAMALEDERCEDMQPAHAPAMENQGMAVRSKASRRASGGFLGELKAAAGRRENRQLYRPPERTREWMETHYHLLPQSEPTKDLVSVNVFWRDYAKAIVEGTTAAFASENILFDGSSALNPVVALALIKAPVTFTRPELPSSGLLQVVERFYDPTAQRANGTLGAPVKDEFVVGRLYKKQVVLTNPTDDSIRESVLLEIPEGAIALGEDGLCCRAVESRIVYVGDLELKMLSSAFYFPQVVDGAPLPVVEKPSKTDTASWAYVSQEGTKGEVLEYLRTKNLEQPSVALEKIAWRMKDGAYAKQVLDVLASRGVYNQELWLAGLLWREAFDPQRIREVLAREDNRRRLGRRLGPVFISPLVTIDPETANIFEHKEYWPIINARAHSVAGGTARLANKQLAQEYRAFLEVLAAKRELAANDRLLAAVFLIAQDRIEEAKAQVAQVKAEEVETKMQLAYLKAYLAFCDGDAEKGRAFAAPYVNHPVKHWQKRFQEVVSQADEIAGKAPVAADAVAALAPTLSLAAEGEAIVLTSRNLATCTVKAYPTDLEILFSKDSFGQDKSRGDAVRCLKPAWTKEVGLKDGVARVELPQALRAKNLVLVASGADGRAEARFERSPRALDVQVSREYRQLRVRTADGKALPGAYVKVYVKDARGAEVKFHKDGYTDLRGAFDYASVSTDTDFRPAEYAIVVLHDTAGVKTLKVAE